MLLKRVIPCLDVKDGRVVKGVNFVDLIDAGDPVEPAAAYDAAAAPFRGPDGMMADGSPTIPDRDYFRRAQEEVIERMIKAGVI